MEINSKLEHTLWRCPNGETIEVCVVTDKTVLFETSYPDKKKAPIMQTCDVEYFAKALKSKRLVNIPVEYFKIQRKLDMKFYQGKGKWVRSIDKAALFAAATIEESLKVFKDKNYEVWKVVA